MAKMSLQQVQQSAEEAARTVRGLYIGQWASWLYYLLRAVDSEAQAQGYNSVTVVLDPVERNLNQRLRSGRW